MTNEEMRALIMELQDKLDAKPTTSAPLGIVPSIDPFLPAGAPFTQYMEITKHVLSNVDTVWNGSNLERAPSPIEGIISYAWRVSDQAHAGEGLPGGQVQARNTIGQGYGIGVPVKGPAGNVVTGPVSVDGHDWNIAVDFFFNRRAYLAVMAPDQLAKELANEKIQQDAMDKLKAQGGG